MNTSLRPFALASFLLAAVPLAGCGDDASDAGADAGAAGQAGTAGTAGSAGKGNAGTSGAGQGGSAGASGTAGQAGAAGKGTAGTAGSAGKGGAGAGGSTGGAAGSAGSGAAGAAGKGGAGAGGAGQGGQAGKAGAGGSAGTGGSAGGAAGASGSAGKGGAGAAGTGGGSGGTAGSAGAAGGSAGAGGAPACDQPKELAAFYDQPLHLTKACSPYHAAAPVTVKTTSFVVDAGVEIRFAPGASLEAIGTDANDGVFQVNGTVADPVVLGPDAPGAAKGSWTGLTVGSTNQDGGTFELHNLRIEGAGIAAQGSDPAHGALLVRAATTIDGVTVASSAGFGVELVAPLAPGSAGLSVAGADDYEVMTSATHVASLPAITSGAGNQKAFIGVTTGLIETGTWVSQPVPLAFLSNIGVGSGANDTAVTLTIQPNKVALAEGVSFTIGATDGQNGTGDLVSTDVDFAALTPGKPWAGILVIARFTSATTITGGSIQGGLDGPWSHPDETQTPTFFNDNYTPLLLDASLADGSWPTVTGVTIHDIGPLPAPPSDTANHDACIVVRGIPCGSAPVPAYAALNTLQCNVQVDNYDSCP